jgi:hypothetical protein
MSLSWSPGFCATGAGQDDPLQCGPERHFAFVLAPDSLTGICAAGSSLPVPDISKIDGGDKTHSGWKLEERRNGWRFWLGWRRLAVRRQRIPRGPSQRALQCHQNSIITSGANFANETKGQRVGASGNDHEVGHPPPMRS